MIRILLFIAAAFLQLATAQRLQDERSCDRRTEVWNKRCNAHCEPICGEGDLVPCSRSGGVADVDVGFNQRICRPACNCKPRYIRESRGGPCIPKSQCNREGSGPIQNPRCGPNEDFLTCGSACPEFCNQPEGTACTAQCVPGCFCKQGYVQQFRGGPCVPKQQCERPDRPVQQCGRNEDFLTCGSACPEFCNQPDGLACTTQCVPGCFCKQGYVQQFRGGPCVPKEQCERPGEQCSRNEEFLDCGSACPAICGEPPATICTTQCVPGCFCKRGFIRQRRDGPCIPLSTCRTRHSPVF